MEGGSSIVESVLQAKTGEQLIASSASSAGYADCRVERLFRVKMNEEGEE